MSAGARRVFQLLCVFIIVGLPGWGFCEIVFFHKSFPVSASRHNR